MAENTVFVCVPERPATALQITFPGIGALQAIKTTMDGIPTPSAAAMLMLGQVSPALSPIIAILRLVDVVVKIIATFKDVPNVFTNPGAVISDIEKLVQSAGLLGDFVPGIPYVRMVRDLLIMVEALIRGIALKMNRWVTESIAIGKAIASAKLLGDTDLQASTTCSANRLIEVQQGTQVSLQDVGQILKVVKLIADIIKSVVPVDLPGISEMADLLDTLATTLAAGAPGLIGNPAEDARVLLLAGKLTHAADEIHLLSVKITEFVGD